MDFPLLIHEYNLSFNKVYESTASTVAIFRSTFAFAAQKEGK